MRGSADARAGFVAADRPGAVCPASDVDSRNAAAIATKTAPITDNDDNWRLRIGTSLASCRLGGSRPEDGRGRIYTSVQAKSEPRPHRVVPARVHQRVP